MLKETQKDKIERLEKKVETDSEIIQKLNDENYKYQENANKGFENSSTYRQMLKEIDDLKLKLKVANDSSKHNREMYENELKRSDVLINEIKETKKCEEHYKELLSNNETTRIKNERGAGRKARFTEQQIAEIKMYRIQGKTIKEIAQMYNCSVGLIHKLINE